MLIPVRSSRFKRDVGKARARGKDMDKVRALLASLVQREPLSARSRDHPLRGIWRSGLVSGFGRSIEQYLQVFRTVTEHVKQPVTTLFDRLRREVHFDEVGGSLDPTGGAKFLPIGRNPGELSAT